MRKMIVVATAFFLVGWTLGRAQSNRNSIELGSTVLHLGMSKASVVAALEKYYTVNDDGQVVSKAEPHKSDGSVSFKDGKLTAVLKSWSPSNQRQAYELANSLFGLFNDLKEEGSVECTFSTSSHQTNDGSEKKSIFMFCGDKDVDIDAVHWQVGDKPDQAAVVTEILRAKKD
jgi:hypothetical protein